jgi:eukaryotic-like serine/threonine-protein kinase
MRYCHECGAEVAPDDAFCAFCGITLNPFPLATIAAAQLPSVTDSESPTLETVATDASASEIVSSNEIESAESNADRQTIAEAVRQEDVESTSDVDADEEPSTIIKKTTADFLGEAENQAPTREYNVAAADQNELQIATIPNIELDGFAREADVPIEEIREEESLMLEPTAEAEISEQNVLPDVARENDSENTAFEFTDDKAVTNEPLPLETDVFGQKVENGGESHETEYSSQLAEKAEKSVSSMFSAPEQSAAENELQQTLISQPLPEKVEVLDELVSNPDDLSVPRATSQQSSPDTPGSKSPKLKPLDNGTILNNRYEIVRRIGGGGMGAVYLASDRNLGGVQRAVKEMIQSYVDDAQHEKAVQDFRRESLMLSALEHPAIPTIYDYFVDETEGRFYLVMKYISGGDLAARFRSAPEGRIDEISMTEWAVQIADVLDYLHNHEPAIVYRDLKPSNIMIDGKTGRIMLVDFGIARWVNKEEKGNTAVGTMGYAPSEQYAGNAEPRSDIYALGATMFHLLTGSDPQNNPLLIFDFTKHPRPRRINPNLSIEIEKIIMRAVEYNASLRFSTAAEMRVALLDHLDRARAGRLTFAPPEQDDAPTTFVPSPTISAAPSMAFCGFCGERIASNDMFCAYCGSKQAEAERVQAAAKAAFPVQRQTARLVLETGMFDEPAFMLEKESNLLGREDRRSNIFPEIDLTRFDARSQVSRRHARIWRQGANYLIEDLGSANGTMLISKDNKSVRLLAHEPHVIAHGDKLKLGETTLNFYTN